jgi:RNA polymerase sigma-70 factor (ECF subfamily)
MAELDEELEWIRKSQQGDHAAFEALIMQHQRMVHSLTFRMTGSLADAEDLAQETFIQAFRKLAGYRGEARFSSWLYRIAVNLCLNWQSRESRQKRLLEDWGQQEAVDARPDVRRAEEVQAALLKVHPKQRAAVVLTTYDGLNHAEAARVLGCSETTVSWRLFAARNKLKKLLAGSQRREEAHDQQGD